MSDRDKVRTITVNGTSVPGTMQLGEGRYFCSCVRKFDAGDEVRLPIDALTITIVEPGTYVIDVREGEKTPATVQRVGER